MPALALAVSLFVLSQSALLVRLASPATALEIGFWRMVIAVPMLLALGLARGGWRELTRLSVRQILGLVLCGACLFLHWWSWFLGVQSTALANSMVLFALSPVFTAIGAWIFFREPFTPRHGVALFCSFLGLFIIFRDSLSLNPQHLRGDVLDFIACMLFSVYVLVSKGMRRGMGNLPFTVVTYASCGIFFFFTIRAQGAIRADFPPSTWAALLALAFGPTLLGHGLFTYCLQFFNVNLMNILILTEPIIGALTGYWILKEPIAPAVALGFGVISAGMLWLFLPALRKMGARA